MLDGATRYQACVLQAKHRFITRREKRPGEKEKALKMLGLLGEAQGSLNEILKWSLRVLDRSLIRNVGSYAWNSTLPESAKDKAKEAGVRSSFEALDGMAASLKKSGIGIMQETGLLDGKGLIACKSKWPKDRFLKKKFIKMNDITNLLLGEECDLKSGDNATELLMGFSGAPTVDLGESLMLRVGPALESRLPKEASSWERAKEVQESLSALPELKARIITLLRGDMAKSLESWSDGVLREVMGIDRCTKELDEVKRASSAYAQSGA